LPPSDQCRFQSQHPRRNGLPWYSHPKSLDSQQSNCHPIQHSHFQYLRLSHIMTPRSLAGQSEIRTRIPIQLDACIVPC
jgi:hypothetical protein